MRSLTIPSPQSLPRHIARIETLSRLAGGAEADVVRRLRSVPPAPRGQLLQRVWHCAAVGAEVGLVGGGYRSVCLAGMGVPFLTTLAVGRNCDYPEAGAARDVLRRGLVAGPALEATVARARAGQTPEGRSLASLSWSVASLALAVGFEVARLGCWTVSVLGSLSGAVALGLGGGTFGLTWGVLDLTCPRLVARVEAALRGAAAPPPPVVAGA